MVCILAQFGVLNQGRTSVRKTSYGVAGVVALMAAATVWLWWTATDLDKPVDFKQTVLNPKPNQFLLCPAGFCKDEAHQILPAFEMSSTALQKAWDDMMQEKPDYKRLDRTDGENRRHYDTRTDGVGFPDRITVEFVPQGDSSSGLAIYSRSKYGYSDGGLNNTRVLGLLADLEARLK